MLSYWSVSGISWPVILWMSSGIGWFLESWTYWHVSLSCAAHRIIPELRTRARARASRHSHRSPVGSLPGHPDCEGSAWCLEWQRLPSHLFDTFPSVLCVCLCRIWCPSIILEPCWVDCPHAARTLTASYAPRPSTVYTRCFTSSCDTKVSTAHDRSVEGHHKNSFFASRIPPYCLFVGFSLDYKDDSVESLLPLKNQLENPDHSVLYKTCSDLTKVNSLTLNSPFVQGLLLLTVCPTLLRCPPVGRQYWIKTATCVVTLPSSTCTLGDEQASAPTAAHDIGVHVVRRAGRQSD